MVNFLLNFGRNGENRKIYHSNLCNLNGEHDEPEDLSWFSYLQFRCCLISPGSSRSMASFGQFLDDHPRNQHWLLGGSGAPHFMNRSNTGPGSRWGLSISLYISARRIHSN